MMIPRGARVGYEYLLAQEPLQGPLLVLDWEMDGTQRAHDFQDSKGLREYLSEHQSYTFRVISIYQQNSWQPLQLTKPMADAIASRHRLSPCFWNILSCFYGRTTDTEASFNIPFCDFPIAACGDTDVVGDGSPYPCPSREVSYSIRYPEQKTAVGGGELVWVMRQSAVLQRHDAARSQNTVIIVSPSPGSAFLLAVKEYMAGQLQNDARSADPDWFHALLFTTYMPSWRWYLESIEGKLSRIANNVIATYIDEPLDQGHDALNSLAALESRCLQTQTVLDRTINQLDDIVTYLQEKNIHGSPTVHFSDQVARSQLQFYRRQCVSHAGTATLFRQRAQMTNQFLANSLSFRDQSMSKEQNRNMLRLNKSAVFVTSLTLVYVPASFMATFFGMNFFDMDEDAGRIIVDPMVWTYVVSTAFLSSLTYLLYYLVLHHQGSLAKQLKSKLTTDIDVFRRSWWLGKNEHVCDQTSLA